MFAATDRSVLSSQMARALARMSPEHGVSPAPPAAGCSPEWMITSGNSVGATAQCRGSARSLGTLWAAVTTSAELGSERYLSLSGACKFLRSIVYGIRPFCPSIMPLLLQGVWQARPPQVRRLDHEHGHDHQDSAHHLDKGQAISQHDHCQEDGDHGLPGAQQ